MEHLLTGHDETVMSASSDVTNEAILYVPSIAACLASLPNVSLCGDELFPHHDTTAGQPMI